jgi:hypothetical protein
MMHGSDPLAALPLPNSRAPTRKLEQLLKQQLALASSADTPAGEARYQAVVAEIAAVSAQIDSARNMEQQHG